MLRPRPIDICKNAVASFFAGAFCITAVLWLALSLMPPPHDGAAFPLVAGLVAGIACAARCIVHDLGYEKGPWS